MPPKFYAKLPDLNTGKKSYFKLTLDRLILYRLKEIWKVLDSLWNYSSLPLIYFKPLILRMAREWNCYRPWYTKLKDDLPINSYIGYQFLTLPWRGVYGVLPPPNICIWLYTFSKAFQNKLFNLYFHNKDWMKYIDYLCLHFPDRKEM